MLMGTTEVPAPSSTAGMSTDCCIEHMFVADGESNEEECVLIPSTDNHEAVATEWISAEDDSYVSLSEIR